MSGISIVGISGSVTRPSRTTALVTQILAAIGARSGLPTRLVELVEAAPVLFRSLTPPQLTDEAREIVHTVERASLLVVATPVYRASYTGALKHLFDLVRRETLAGKPAILAATGGNPLHGLVTEHELRPLLSFFNALTVPTTIYATETSFLDYRLVDAAVEERIERAATEALDLLEFRLQTAAPGDASSRPARRLVTG